MLRRTLFFILALLLAITVIGKVGIPTIFASDISPRNLIEFANMERTHRNLTTLRYSKKLEEAAYAKAQNMFSQQYWAHYGPHNESPWQFILGTGYQYTYAGENLAKGFTDSEAVHNAWMASPSHRDNLLDPVYDEIGIAVVKGNLQGSDVFLVVQMFGTTTYHPEGQVRNYPYIKITSPKDGDILDEGIFTVRGEVRDIQNNGVDMYLNTTLLQRATAIDGKNINYTMPTVVANGDNTVSMKAVGNGEEYLFDRVAFKVQAKTMPLSDTVLNTCVQADADLVNYAILFNCGAEKGIAPKSLSITLSGVTYNADAQDSLRVLVPKASIPKEASKVELTVNFSDGSSRFWQMDMGNLNMVAASTIQKSTDANTFIAYLARNISIRDVFWSLLGVFLVLLLIYAIRLTRIREFHAHRGELLVFLITAGVISITFVMGFVHV